MTSVMSRLSAAHCVDIIGVFMAPVQMSLLAALSAGSSWKKNKLRCFFSCQMIGGLDIFHHLGAVKAVNTKCGGEHVSK